MITSAIILYVETKMIICSRTAISKILIYTKNRILQTSLSQTIIKL